MTVWDVTPPWEVVKWPQLPQLGPRLQWVQHLCSVPDQTAPGLSFRAHPINTLPAKHKPSQAFFPDLNKRRINTSLALQSVQHFSLCTCWILALIYSTSSYWPCPKTPSRAESRPGFWDTRHCCTLRIWANSYLSLTSILCLNTFLRSSCYSNILTFRL